MIRRNARRFVAIGIAAVLLAITWLRDPNVLRPSQNFVVTQVSIPVPPDGAPLSVTDIWDIDGEGAGFGGFSALIAMPGAQLRSFSDRGWRFTFAMSEDGPTAFATGEVATVPGYASALFDIEAATESEDGTVYWLGYEAFHAVHSFSGDDEPLTLGSLDDDVDWPANGGIEALVRLQDGRFLAFPEASAFGYVFAGDPSRSIDRRGFAISWPREDYRPTDAAQLPDGRVLVLMRKFSFEPAPTFSSLLVIGDPPHPDAAWTPQVFAELDRLLPRENYEGLALRALEGGSTELWLISDDNFSAFQRTLLVRMELRRAG